MNTDKRGRQGAVDCRGDANTRTYTDGHGLTRTRRGRQAAENCRGRGHADGHGLGAESEGMAD